MANPNLPFGFQLLQSEGKENRARIYNKTTGTALYQGDAVKLISAGTVSIAAAGDRIIGVVAKNETSAASTVEVYDDPLCLFAVQMSGDWQLADVGQNANIVANAADTSLNRSKHTLDSAMNTTAAFQFKILGLLSRGANAVGSYAIVRAKPNFHEFSVQVSGV